MSHQFLDTSALVKHYHPEVGTPAVDRLWADPVAKLFISRLSVVETVSVFARKVRTGVILATDMALLRRRFYADLRRRRPMIVRMLARHFQEADRLLQMHSPTHNLNTLDALQLAIALDVNRQGMLDEFVTADRVLLSVAPLEGLATRNPETP